MHIDKFSKKVFGGGYTPQCIVCFPSGHGCYDNLTAAMGVSKRNIGLPTSARYGNNETLGYDVSSFEGYVETLTTTHLLT